MADIVISHAMEDRDRAEIIARSLSAQGLKVWMYRDILGGGGDRDEVAAKVRDATRVIAMWSPAGCASQWVLEEARAAAQDHRLINVELQSGLTPRAFQAGLRIDLSAWAGQRNDPALEPVAQAIATIVSKNTVPVEKRSGVSVFPGAKHKERESVAANVAPAPSMAESALRAESTPGPSRAAAADETPLKIEVFEKSKPKSPETSKKHGRHWWDMSMGRAFALGLVVSVVIGVCVVVVRHSFNSHPMAVAARAAAKQAVDSPEISGYVAMPETLKFVRELESESTSLSAAAYGSNEWLQAIANSDGAVRTYEADDGKFYKKFDADGKPLTDVAFDGGAQYLGATSVDGGLYIWRISDGFRTRISLGDSPVRKLAWHPTDVLLVTGNDSGVLDIRSAQGDAAVIRRSFDSPITALAWRKDAAVIAVGFKSGKIVFVSPATGEVSYKAFGHTGAITGVAFSPDNSELASIGEDGVTKLWNADTGEIISNIPSRPCTQSELSKEGLCPNLDVTYSPDGTILLVSNQKGEVDGYKPKTGERAVWIRGHHAPVTGIAWSRYDHRITSVDAAGKAVFWTSPFDKPWKPAESQ